MVLFDVLAISVLFALVVLVFLFLTQLVTPFMEHTPYFPMIRNMLARRKSAKK